MAIIKLEKGGPGVSFIARGMTPDESTQGREPIAQWKLVGQTPDDDKAALWIAQDTLARQLKRLGIAEERFLGTVLVYSRSEKNYIDINLPVQPFPGTSPAAAPSVAAPMTDEEKKAVIATEKALLSYALGCAHKKLLPEYLAGHGFDDETLPEAVIVQAVATLGAALYQGLSARGVTR